MSQPIVFIKSSIGSVSIAASQVVNGVNTPYRWNAILGITAQAHSDGTTTPTPYFYTGMNVAVGDYICSDADGTSLMIASISSQSSSTVTCILQDVNSFNALQDSTGNMNGLIQNGPGIVGYIFAISNGVPILGNIPAALPGNLSGTSFAANIQSRFATMATSVPGVNPVTGFLPSTVIPPASATGQGGVKVAAVGPLAVAADGTLTLNPATTTVTGGVKVPAGGPLAVAADGTLTVAPSTIAALGITDAYTETQVNTLLASGNLLGIVDGGNMDAPVAPTNVLDAGTY